MGWVVSDLIQRRAAVANLAALIVAACSSRSTVDDAAAPPQIGGGSSSALSGRANARLEGLRDDLIAFRRDLHRHPELSGQETRTAARIAERLEPLGFSVRRHVGGHGVVAVLQGGSPGPVVAFRADMDAVASDAADPVDFGSEIPGARHVCGHDIHATIGVALAEAFAAIGQDFPGTVVLIFQPAEETITGAKQMIEAGALRNPRPHAIFAFHSAPYGVGQIAYSETTLMSQRDRVTVSVFGGSNPRQIAEQLRAHLLSLGNIASLSALQPIGSDFAWVGADPLTQDTSGSWLVNANFSLATDAARRRLREGVDRAVADLANSAPATRFSINYSARWAPGVTNDAALTRSAAASIRAQLGANALVQVRNVSPVFSEDFGWMLDEVPGAMFFLGVSNERRGWVGIPHSPEFVADEDAIFVGANAMMRIMLDILTSR